MSKSVKFKDNIYLDTSSIVHNKESLNSILGKLSVNKDTYGKNLYMYSLCTNNYKNISFDIHTNHLAAFMFAEQNHMSVSCSLAYFYGVNNIVGSMASYSDGKITLSLSEWSYVVIISTLPLEFNYSK